MKYISLFLVLSCMVLMPLFAQAGEKPIIYYSFDVIKGDNVEDLSGSVSPNR